MTIENWQIMKARVAMRRRREEWIWQNVKDAATVFAGIGICLLLCGCMWIGG